MKVAERILRFVHPLRLAAWPRARHGFDKAEELFNRVQQQLDKHKRRRRQKAVTRFERAPLTGKLFDASGEVMSPSFATNRHGRRYRYYVSASLLQGANPKDDAVLRRVSAPEIERTIRSVIERWVPQTTNPLGQPIAIYLEQDGLRVDWPIDRAIEVKSRLSDGERILRESRNCISIHTPISLPLRGGRQIIVAGNSPPAKPDRTLIAALRKAHAMLSTERGLPIIRKAPASPHDGKLLRLAFLAPDLQREILSGKQPPSLTLEKFKRLKIPLSWKAQREVLGWLK